MASISGIDISEICNAIIKGEDVTKIVENIEPQLKVFCEKRYNGIPIFDIFEDILCDEDALYEVSPSIKTYWDSVYTTFQNPKDKYQALLRFVNARERLLGTSHIESVHILKKCGWTDADIMASYIHNRVRGGKLILSPDVAEEAVKEDWETALQLLEGKNYDIFFPFYNKSYQMLRQFEWIDFLYCFVGYNDETFLRKSHKSKRLCKYCDQILEKLSHTPIRTDNFQKINDCPDFSVFQNIVLHQKHLIRSAARQKLKSGNIRNQYVMSFHFIDEQQGCGAALCFDALIKLSGYDSNTSDSKDVYFYRFNHLYLSDYIAESRREIPEKMPNEFVNQAYRAFSMVAGLDEKNSM